MSSSSRLSFGSTHASADASQIWPFLHSAVVLVVAGGVSLPLPAANAMAGAKSAAIQRVLVIAMSPEKERQTGFPIRRMEEE